MMKTHQPLSENDYRLKVAQAHIAHLERQLKETQHDLARLRQIEAERYHAEMHYRQVFEGLSLPRLIIDPANGRIVEANHAASAFYGYPVSELRKMNWQRLSTAEEAETKLQMQSILSGHMHHYTAAQRRADNSQRSVVILCGVLALDNKQYVDVVLWDGPRDNSRFLSLALHDLRLPLSSILALTETMLLYRQNLTDDQIAHKLLRIKDQVGQLNDLMEDVLQLARLQAHRVNIHLASLDVNALCMDVLNDFASQPGFAHRVVYSCHTCHEKSPIAHLDQRLIRKVINNLMSNAIKYSPPDRDITVDLRHQNDVITLKVQDQGIGIPPEDLPYVFEAFHRAANVQAVTGSGLGLVIAKEAVEAHGGTISIESQVSIGTTVIVSLPVGAMR